jgi:lipoyl synthase
MKMATDRKVLPKPPWLRVRLANGKVSDQVRDTMRWLGLQTVCEQAHCPNQGECWSRGTATVLILGDVCTRRCGFCAVRSGIPKAVNSDEPQRVAEAVAALEWRHVVITSVTRDDLPDGGAAQFAACVEAIRQTAPGCSIELLIPEFQGSAGALEQVVGSGPDVLAHNVETVPRLYPTARPQANFERSLRLLSLVKELQPRLISKSGIMVGIGEGREELVGAMHRLREVGCDILTVGQYLAPSRHHLPVMRYYTPEEFAAIREIGLALGFDWVEAGPLVRSSYHAERHAHHTGINHKDCRGTTTTEVPSKR